QASAESGTAGEGRERADLKAEIGRLEGELAALKSAKNDLRIRLPQFQLTAMEGKGPRRFGAQGGTDGATWRFAGVEGDRVTLSAGG
ncbi:MAG: hypothetical protein ABEK42_01420, partial [Thiohalorhabdaceae bacterium]